ncbi:MAG: hypothetical protein LBC91_03090 [Candidatus Accumulibacter sp.]|jgi:hypothetical protein|nr:hypothetical protein [Accumulibacter sp.]
MSVHDEDGGKTPTMPLKRRRSFLAARNAKADDVPVRTEEIEPIPIEEDDIPTLTEIVTEEKKEDASPPAAPDGEAPTVEEAPASARTDLEELAAQMARAIDQQMAYELPTLIEATLLDTVATLRAGIASTVEAALHDFVAGQKRDRPDDEWAPRREYGTRASSSQAGPRPAHHCSFTPIHASMTDTTYSYKRKRP